MNRSLVLTALSSLSLLSAGCDGLLPLVDVAGPYGSTIRTCASLQVESSGDLGTDVVGTWQDWAGGTDKVTQFNSDGTVTLSVMTAGADASVVTMRVEASGKWATHENRLDISWDDGTSESMPALFETIPGCTMLLLRIPDNSTSRLSVASELERVSCAQSVVPAAVVGR